MVELLFGQTFFFFKPKKFTITRYTYICCDIPGDKKNMHKKYKKNLKNNRKMKIIKTKRKKKNKNMNFKCNINVKAMNQKSIKKAVH